jgi:hypothetical protein
MLNKTTKTRREFFITIILLRQLVCSYFLERKSAKFLLKIFLFSELVKNT